MTDHADKDERTPSPPFGYSKPCALSHDAQIEVVAQFHANHIRPNRIAYRMGVDIALVEALIAGELEPERFAARVDYHRRQRFRDRMHKTSQKRGTGRYELQQQIEKDFQRETQNSTSP